MSRLFSGCFALVSPLLPARTREKVSVISSRATKATLNEYIDDDELHVFLGGNKIDDGFICSALPLPEDLAEQLPEGTDAAESAGTAATAAEGDEVESEESVGWFGSAKVTKVVEL